MTGKDLPIVQVYPLRLDPGHRAIQKEIDAAPHHFSRGIFAQVSIESGKNSLADFDEGNPAISLLHVRIETRGLPKKDVELARDFHSGEATSHHHEVEKGAPFLRIGRGIGPLQHLDGTIPKRHGIRQALELETKLIQSRHFGKSGDTSQGEDEVIIWHLVGRPATQRFTDDLPAPQVDIENFRHTKGRLAKEGTERYDGVTGFEAAGTCLNEKRVENEIIIAIDQERSRLHTPETLLESLRAIGSAKPSTENDETTHVRAPASRPGP
jgi:hypothetical protein